MEIIREIGKKGQIVIPIDIREIINLKEKDKITISIKNNEIIMKKQENKKERLNNFFTKVRTNKSDLSLKDLKKIEEESYDLP